MANRRQFLAGLLATGLAPVPTWADAGNPAYLSAARLPDGRYVLTGLDREGVERFRIPLPDRGHAAAAHPTQPIAVAFARRPGRFALVLDCRDGAVLAQLHSPEGRHFYGHGSFDASGDYLFTTENDYDAGEGRIGVWDAAKGYARIGEFASGGVGPHDIKLLPDGGFVVANGGIDTHPDSGRLKLNLSTMQPNLAYLSATGALLENVAPAHHHASTRHLAVRADGLVAVGMQWQGDVASAPALVALHRRGAPLQMLGDASALDGYVGSIAFSGDGAQVAITSPRGGTLEVFDATSGALVQRLAEADICGVAAADHGLLATTGLGHVIRADTATQTLQSASLAYDNHLVAIAPRG
ncbi:DUF1513 domain-containing protein [Pseudosulfitobacter koreensis]|uniref:DUF1513 domain-containing protein n=1 Tax=Pseudosulfitobacter koreensis TaxID=2968472 RepID=A0ABT1Z2Y8_9RHOB|nr:DUF1513 domain-containing protein [Pseudosulfitobacter koreense]MCR8827504.1 DUF1513 domain-containing protein [Pseudosulfitobacter koreense]